MAPNSRPGPPGLDREKTENMVSPGNGPEIISRPQVWGFKLSCRVQLRQGLQTAAFICAGATKCRSKPSPSPSRPAITPAASTAFLLLRPSCRVRPIKWQTFDITLIGRHVTVVQNGTTIIDDEEIPGLTGGALDSREGLQGPIYLQGSEKGHVQFRRITIAPAK